MAGGGRFDAVDDQLDIDVTYGRAACDGVKHRACDGDAAPQASFVEIGGQAAISTIKTSEDGRGVIVRIFNPTTKRSAVSVKPHFEYAKAARVDLEEQPLEKLTPNAKSQVSFALKAKEVASLKFEF